MDKKAKKSSAYKDKINIIIAIQAGLIVLFTITVGILAGQPPRIVTNFEQCSEIFGSEITETRTWTRIERACDINDVRFYERDMVAPPPSDSQRSRGGHDGSSRSGREFLGLTEEVAVAKAERADRPVRVLERDSEPFPATMDLVEGRVNLYIKDGVVYRVNIEGVDADEGPY